MVPTFESVDEILRCGHSNRRASVVVCIVQFVCLPGILLRTSHAPKGRHYLQCRRTAVALTCVAFVCGF